MFKRKINSLFYFFTTIMITNPYWQTFFESQAQQSYFIELQQEIKARRSCCVVYPPESQVYAAFEAVAPTDVKVVILGQDPYHGPNQANGLSFSVNKGEKIPPSLRNMFKELVDEFDDFTMPNHGDLSHWAEQGVMLLNATLTVEQGNANAHQKLGWQTFTDEAIRYISDQAEGVVFMLWGAFAQKKEGLIDAKRHHILKSVHPSPLSARKGFFGNKHFITANELLVNQGKSPITWHLP